MPYVTDTEVLSYQRGRNEGRLEAKIEGKLEFALQILTRSVGALSDELMDRINALSLDQKERFCQAALDFQNLNEVQSWLRENA